ncbi:MAG: hypothetical protein IKP86_14060, partial [Anaerolineaceae bacterium]|nr:hypothetical protein [Anaerolineaceae bacterium]
EILSAAVCDDAVRILRENDCLEQTLSRLSLRIRDNLDRRAGENLMTEVIVFSNVWGILLESDGAEALLTRIAGGE